MKNYTFKSLVQGSSPDNPTNVMIDKCIKCDTKIPDERVHLGYRECVECSSIEGDYSLLSCIHTRQIFMFNRFQKKQKTI